MDNVNTVFGRVWIPNKWLSQDHILTELMSCSQFVVSELPANEFLSRRTISLLPLRSCLCQTKPKSKKRAIAVFATHAWYYQRWGFVWARCFGKIQPWEASSSSSLQSDIRRTTNDLCFRVPLHLRDLFGMFSITILRKLSLLEKMLSTPVLQCKLTVSDCFHCMLNNQRWII